MDPATWLMIAAGTADVLSQLFGMSAEADQRADIKKGILLDYNETKRRLELEKSNTLSQLVARAGRAGVETATTTSTTTPTITRQPSPGALSRLKPEVADLMLPSRTTDVTSGAGGSVMAHQQRVADLYEQELIYQRKRASAAYSAATPSGAELASGFLDAVGTILETGTDLYESWYKQTLTNIPGSYDPYKVKLGFGDTWGEGY